MATSFKRGMFAFMMNKTFDLHSLRRIANKVHLKIVVTNMEPYDILLHA